MLLERLQAWIDSLDQHTKDVFRSDLETMIGFWEKEKTFDYDALPTYKFGDVIHVDLCYNVGSETGGNRYAVVIEDSPKSSHNVIIIPIHGEDVYRPAKNHELYIGRPLDRMTKSHHYLNVTQLRAISKMRIDGKFAKLDTGLVMEIKSVIRRRLNLA